MPPGNIPILDRLHARQYRGLDQANRRAGVPTVRRFRCNRLLDPATTVDLLLVKVLHGNTACRHLVLLTLRSSRRAPDADGTWDEAGMRQDGGREPRGASDPG